MAFSFIIINYRTTALTAQCLDSIFSFCRGTDREIILIDNASGDGGAAELEKHFGSRLKIIKNSDNLGFAAANNQGAKLARGEYLFFLNSDTLLAADPLPALAKNFAARPDFGLLAPKLLRPDGVWQAGACGHFPTIFSLLARTAGKNWPKLASADLAQTDWVSGAALVIRRSLFEKINGWDEKYFLYYEDIDLCWRAKNAGAKIGICSAIPLTHLGGKSLAQDAARKRHYYRSQTYFFRKNYGILPALVMRLIRWPYKILRS